MRSHRLKEQVYRHVDQVQFENPGILPCYRNKKTQTHNLEIQVFSVTLSTTPPGTLLSSELRGCMVLSLASNMNTLSAFNTHSVCLQVDGSNRYLRKNHLHSRREGKQVRGCCGRARLPSGHPRSCQSCVRVTQLSHRSTQSHQSSHFLFCSFEPKQTSSKVHIHFPQEGDALALTDLADKIASAAGLKRVGWMFTDIERDAQVPNRYLQKRHAGTYFLKPNELALAAHLQSEFPSRCDFAKCGYAGSKFCTVVLSGGNAQPVNNIEPFVYQVCFV